MSAGCAIDVFALASKVVDLNIDSNSPQLYFDDITKKYGFQSGSRIKTNFSRVIKIDKMDVRDTHADGTESTVEVKVTVTVLRL